MGMEFQGLEKEYAERIVSEIDLGRVPMAFTEALIASPYPI
jgi:hypothetical protein